MRLLASILALAIIGSMSAVPVPPASSVNPCTIEALHNVQYFHPSASGEPREYIECNPWGGMMVRMCPEGSVWDRELVDCMFANRTVLNTTFSVIEESALFNETMANQSLPMSNPFCSYVGNYTCMNNGICTQLEDGFRCLCLSGFAGDYCERVEKESTGVFGIMINSSFSLDLYKLNRAMFNMSSVSNMSSEFDLTFNGSAMIDQATRAKISSYIARYQNGSIRFDTLVNFFIDDFLSIIYPDAFMLREFYFEPEIKMGFSNAIPRLLMITKYTYDNFEHLFAIFDDLLVRLSDYLMIQQPIIKEEAAQFYEVYDALNAKLDSLYNITDSIMGQSNHTLDMERVSMRQLFLEKLRFELNCTLVATYELFRGLVSLQDEISRRQQFGEITMEQIAWEISNFTVQPETVTLINEIISRNNMIWDILSYYGFSSVLQRMVPVRVMPTAGALVGIVSQSGDEEIWNGEEKKKDERQVDEEDEQVESDEKKTDSQRQLNSLDEDDIEDVVLTSEALIADDSEIIKPQAQLSANETMPAALMAEANSTVVRSLNVSTSALMAEANSTAIRSLNVSTSALMAEANSTVAVTPAAQMAEITTTITATPAVLIAEATTLAASLVAENAITTPTAAPSLREALEKVQKLTDTKN